MNESSAGATETVATDAAGALTPADVHRSLPTRHTLKEFVFQLVTITAGVLIALAIDGVVEWKQNRDLVREATATITREITDNRAALERHLAEADTREKDTDHALQLMQDLLAAKVSDVKQLNLSFHLSTLSSAAWQSAERTGAVAHFEYATVQKYAKLYNVQALYEGEQRRVMAQVVSALSTLSGNLDPHQAAPADLERFRQHVLALRGALLVDRQLGDSLLRAYKETLAQ